MHGLERETLNMKQEKGNLIYGFHTFVFSCHDPYLVISKTILSVFRKNLISELL